MPMVPLADTRKTLACTQMKAISNFKALLPSRSRLNSPRMNSPRLNLSPEDANTPTQSHHPPTARPRHKPKPSMDEQEMAAFKLQNEEHAARLLEERKRAFQYRGNNNNSTGGGAPRVAPATAPREEFAGEAVVVDARVHGDAPSTTPLLLGIGTGGYSSHFNPGAASSPNDDEQQQEPPLAVVADSPTAVDFNVYDRAYEEELRRIQQAGGRPNVYMTRHVNSTERFRAQQGSIGGGGGVNILEDERRRLGRHDDDNGGPGGVFQANNNNNNHRFADLVALAIKDGRAKTQAQGEGEQQEGSG